MAGTQGHIGFGVGLLGDKALMKALQELAGKAQESAMTKAMRAAGRAVTTTARRLAPKGKTGLLRKSLGLKVGKVKRDRNVTYAVVGPRSKPSFKRIINGKPVNPVRYAHLVELGTVRAAAKPFLRPALTQNEAKALQLAKEKLWHEIERIRTR